VPGPDDFSRLDEVGKAAYLGVGPDRGLGGRRGAGSGLRMPHIVNQSAIELFSR
jgi:hypothetical protein